MKLINNGRVAWLLTLGAAVFLSGCAGAQLKDNVELDSALMIGNYGEAALIAERRMGIAPAPDVEHRVPVVYQPKHVLAHLEAAESWRMLGDLDRSIEHYDAVENAIGDVSENVAGAAAGKVGAALINESLASYVPSPAESVLVNYYKALMFLSLGKGDLARVELNRADDRTRRAVERYSKEIAAAQAEAEQKKSDQTYGNPKVSGQVDSQFPEMLQWAPYAEFIVPPVTFLQALYLAHSSDPADHEKAVELYERLGGVVGTHLALNNDMTEISSGNVCPEDDCVWLLVENSRGPELTERRFGYTAFTGASVVNVQMALPALVSRYDASFSDCTINYGDESMACEPFASMDRVIQTEFSKRFPGIVTRAVVSAAVKAVAQDQISRQTGLLGGLLAAAITDSVTTADIRMWRSLPGEFTLNRIHRNGDPDVTLNIAGRSVDVNLPQIGSQLIHVKTPLAHLPSVVTVINL